MGSTMLPRGQAQDSYGGKKTAGAGWEELLTAFLRRLCDPLMGRLKRHTLVQITNVWGRPGKERGRCGKYSASCREEPKKETTLADLLSVFLAQGHPGGGLPI